MRWTQLKKQVENFLAPSLEGRVQLHSTGYRDAYEERGRAWITVDGVEIASFCDFRQENIWRQEGQRLHPEGWPFSDLAYQAVVKANLISRHEFNLALRAYLNMSTEDAIASTCPITRALVVLDRRVGKRRLRELDVSRDQDFVQRLYQLRMEAEKNILTSRETP